MTAGGSAWGGGDGSARGDGDGSAQAGVFPLPVILRSASDEGSFSVGPVGDGRRSFAVLRMTMGKALRMTEGGAQGNKERCSG